MPNTDELPNDISALKDLLLLESRRVQEANSRAEAEAQRAEAEAQRAEAEAQRAEVEAQKVVAEQRKNQSLLEIIEGLERQLFGRKTERLCTPNENQMRLFDFDTDELSPEDNANEDDESNDSEDSSNEQRKKRKQRGRKKGAPGRQGFPAHFPRIDVTATDSGPTTCPCCDENLTHIGFDVSERLETIPAKFVVLRIKRAKRVCKNCPKQGVITQQPHLFHKTGQNTGMGSSHWFWWTNLRITYPCVAKSSDSKETESTFPSPIFAEWFKSQRIC